MIRLTLCCLFRDIPIKYRTTTARYLSSLKEPFDYVSAIIADNITSLQETIRYCAENQISSFRINSAFFPVSTHPDFSYSIKDLPGHEKLLKGLTKIKQEAEKNNIRFSLHPDQFVVLSSPKEDVVAHSIAELEYHGALAELVGADVINIHGGGGYGDKASALMRFRDNFNKLSEGVRRRLTVENDDKVYSPEELLPLCHTLNIPLVYDVHHHRCLPDSLSIEQATQLALKTWNREPLFHISSPLGGWKSKNPKLHDDYINPDDMPLCWKNIDPLTVDVEAKAKEIAVLQLKNELIKRCFV